MACSAVRENKLKQAETSRTMTSRTGPEKQGALHLHPRDGTVKQEQDKMQARKTIIHMIIKHQVMFILFQLQLHHHWLP
jgi:hypothetical protein